MQALLAHEPHLGVEGERGGVVGFGLEDDLVDGLARGVIWRERVDERGGRGEHDGEGEAEEVGRCGVERRISVRRWLDSPSQQSREKDAPTPRPRNALVVLSIARYPRMSGLRAGSCSCAASPSLLDSTGSDLDDLVCGSCLQMTTPIGSPFEQACARDKG